MKRIFFIISAVVFGAIAFLLSYITLIHILDKIDSSLVNGLFLQGTAQTTEEGLRSIRSLQKNRLTPYIAFLGIMGLCIYVRHMLTSKKKRKTSLTKLYYVVIPLVLFVGLQMSRFVSGLLVDTTTKREANIGIHNELLLSTSMQKLPTSYRCQDLFLTMYENLLSCRITYTDEECFEAFNKTQNLAKEMYGSDIVDDNLMCDEHITRLAEIQGGCGEYVRLAYGSFANKEQLTCFTETIQENLGTTGDIKQFFEQKMQTIKDKTPTQDQDTEFLNCQEIQLEYVDDTLLCLQNIEKIDQQSTALEQQQTREQTMEQISLCTENYQTRKEAATNTYDNPHKQLVQACGKIVSYHNQKEGICDIERNNQYAYLNADTDPNGLQEFWFNKTQCYRDVINSPKTIETLYKQKIGDGGSLNICANINQCAADEVCHQQINRCIKSGLKLQTKNELEDFIKSNTIASMGCAHSGVCSISTSTIGGQEGTSGSKTLYYKNGIPVRDLLEKYNQTDIQQRTE